MTVNQISSRPAAAGTVRGNIPEAALCIFVNPKQCGFEATLCFETTQCYFKATLCGFEVRTQLLRCYPRLTTIYYKFTAQLPEPETMTI